VAGRQGSEKGGRQNKEYRHGSARSGGEAVQVVVCAAARPRTMAFGMVGNGEGRCVVVVAREGAAGYGRKAQNYDRLWH